MRTEQENKNLKKITDFADKSLLIVDDDNPLRDRLARAIEKKGFQKIEEGARNEFIGIKYLLKEIFLLSIWHNQYLAIPSTLFCSNHGFFDLIEIKTRVNICIQIALCNHWNNHS